MSISVIIPAHFAEPFIEETLATVFAQTHLPLEVLLIENGSKDRTEQIAQGFPRVHYSHLTQGHTARARNEGILQAQGEFIAFLDQDDLWEQEKLFWQLEFLQKNPSFEGVIGKQEMFLLPGIDKPHWLKQEHLDSPQWGFLPSALMVKRSCFEKTGLFWEEFPLGSDMAWFLHAKHLGIAIGTDERVVVRRKIHRSNASSRVDLLQKELLQSIHLCLQKKRDLNIIG